MTTGTVIRKMIRSTSITSVSGDDVDVGHRRRLRRLLDYCVLPYGGSLSSNSATRSPARRAGRTPRRLTWRSSACRHRLGSARRLAAARRAAPPRRRAGPPADARLHRAVRHQVAVQVVREGREVLHDRLVAADQPVVGEHRRNRDDQAERGHDQRFTDRAGDRVDRRLAGRADLDQRAVDADDGAEQTDERSGRTDGREEGEAFAETGADRALAARQAVRHPVVLVDRIGQLAVLLLREQARRRRSRDRRSSPRAWSMPRAGSASSRSSSGPCGPG